MSKSTLYDIANEFEKSLDNLLDHDDSDLIKEIESIEGEFKSKSANVAKYIRNLEHLAQGIKEIERSQRDRRNSLEKKIARLKDYLRINFEKTNTEKIESDDIVKSALPDDMLRVFMHYKNDEWEKFLSAVTQWDVDTYLDVLP